MPLNAALMMTSRGESTHVRSLVLASLTTMGDRRMQLDGQSAGSILPVQTGRKSVDRLGSDPQIVESPILWLQRRMQTKNHGRTLLQKETGQIRPLEGEHFPDSCCGRMGRWSRDIDNDKLPPETSFL